MAYDYNKLKSAWDQMDENQRKQMSEQYGNNADFQKFTQEYNSGSAGTASSTNTNKDTSHYDPIYYRNEENNTEWTNTQSSTTNASNSNNGNGSTWGYWNNNVDTSSNNGTGNNGGSKYNYDPNEVLDRSKFWASDGKITIEAGTGKDTWRPDYVDESQERLDEMVGNLNTYYQQSPRIFNNRESYNDFFQYNQRTSQAQKNLLDSYWKSIDSNKKASSYSTGQAFWEDLNNGKVTEAVYSSMKDWNPEVFMQWQKEQFDQMNLAISNLAKIAEWLTNAELLTDLVNKLGIQAGEGRDIIWGWEEMMDRTWAWDAMKEADEARTKYNATADEMTRIMKNYASSTGWSQSDALVAARLNKALAPYQQQASNYYSAWQMANTSFQTKLGTANNYASEIQAQALEDKRVFQRKLDSLGFAMQVNSYRTPEQQAALQLQTQQIQNDMTLYQQSRLNELQLYNQKQQNELNLQYQEDLAKMQNRLESELSNLDVDDPQQQRANLNRVVGQYFEKYWDIIQRSQSQVVDDVLAYAKANGISVGQALKENFIEPLQWKTEYQNMLATKYPDIKADQDSYTYTIDEKWNIKITYSWKWDMNLSDIQKQQLLSQKQTYEWSWMKWAGLRNNNPWNIKDTGFWNVLGTDDRWFAIFSCPEDWFDALVEKIENVQRGWSKTYSPNMTLYEFFAKYAPSSDNNNPKAYAESVAKQLWTTANAKVSSVDATKFAAAIAKHDSWYNYSTYWQFRNNAGTITSDTWTRNDWTVFNVWQSATYNSLDDKSKAAVHQLLNNSIAKTQINSRVYSDPEWILAAVSEINPMWAETDFNNRKTAESAWAKSEQWWALSRNATAATAAKRIFDFIDTISDKDLKRTWIKTLNDLVNATSEQIGNDSITRLKTLLATLQSEAAGALKWWNSSISDKDKADMENIFSAGMTNSQIKAAMEEMVKLLYDKNETEARAISEYWFYKKKPIWTDDIQNWMTNDLGIDLSVYYNYASPDQYFSDYKIADFDYNTLDSGFISYMTNNNG